MKEKNSPEITQLLLKWRDGDERALDDLLPQVYGELRRMAGNFMRRQKPGHTLQPSALVNEAYLRLIGSDQVNWQNRTHFFAMCAQLMRRILVDVARRKNSLKRGGDPIQVTLSEHLAASSEATEDLVALDSALERLARLSERQARIVELRYFAGLTDEQIAEALEISSRTVRRDWTIARAWLYRELRSSV
ncbi:MAG TPA: sigma-70 family RNA polymerase sigma factor [Pyrinomonadaceae bacterium]|nr:sigma-70 family RNA polymerase sigma factor [Pyrinomonadaceae bacterium]